MLVKKIFYQPRLFSESFTTATATSGSSHPYKLYKPHLQKYFENNHTLVDKEIKNLSKKYSLDQRGIQRLFRLKPQVFIPESAQRNQIEDKIKFLNKLQESEPMAGLLNGLLFDNRHLMISMNQADIYNFINEVKSFGFNDEKANTVFNSCSNLIHKKFDIIYSEKLSILTDYLNISKEQALQIFVGQPFLLTCSSTRLRESIVFFLSRQNSVLTKSKIINLLKYFGQIFLIGKQQLNALVQIFKGWGIQKNDLWKVLLNNPLLLLNHPGDIFHFKFKMLRQFRFTTEMAKTLLLQHPASFICSVRALQSKFLVARDRLRINFTPNNLQYFTFKFSANIRPRTEMLIRAKVPYTSEDIVDYFKCSQKQFLAKTGVPAEKLQEQKNRFPITMEIDYPNKKVLKNYPSADKIFEASKKYYPSEDWIITPKGK